MHHEIHKLFLNTYLHLYKDHRNHLTVTKKIYMLLLIYANSELRESLEVLKYENVHCLTVAE